MASDVDVYDDIGRLAERIGRLERRTDQPIDGALVAPGTMPSEVFAPGTLDGTVVAEGSLPANVFGEGTVPGNVIIPGTLAVDTLDASTGMIDMLTSGQIDVDLLNATAASIGFLKVGTVDADMVEFNTAMGDKLLLNLEIANDIVTNGLSAITAKLGSVQSGGIESGYISIGSGTGGTIRMGDAIPTSVGTKSGIVMSKSDGTITGLFERDTGDIEILGHIVDGSTGLGNFDDQITSAQFQLAVGGHNYLRNSGWESSVNYQFWTSDIGSSAQQSMDSVAANVRTGAKALKIIANNTFIRRAQDVLLPKGRYVYTGWVATTSIAGGTGAKISAEALTGTITQISATNIPSTGTTPYTRQKIVLDVTSASASVRFRVGVGDLVGAATSGTAWFEDLQVEDGEIPTGYKPRPDEILPGSIRGGLDGLNSMVAAGTFVGTDMVIDTIGVRELNAAEITAIDLDTGSARIGKLRAGAVDAPAINVTFGGANHLASYGPSFEAGTAYSSISVTSATAALITGATDGKYGSSYWRGTTTVASGTTQLYDRTRTVFRDPNVPYTVSAWVRNNSASARSMSVTAQVLTPGGTLLSQNGGTITAQPGAWSLIRYTVPAGTDLTGTRLGIGVNYTPLAIGETFDVDTFQIEEGDVGTAFTLFGPTPLASTQITPGAILSSHLNITLPGGNLIDDSGFTKIGAGSAVPSSWALTGTTSVAVEAATLGIPKGLNVPFRLTINHPTGAGANPHFLVNWISVEPLKPITISAWVYLAAGDTVRLGIQEATALAGGGTLTFPATGFADTVVSTAVWTYVKATVIPTSTALSVRPYFQVLTAAASPTVWAGMKAEKGEFATPWEPFVDGTVIDGGTITAGIFQTARPGAGNRLVADVNGINFYDASLANTVSLSTGQGGTVAGLSLVGYNSVVNVPGSVPGERALKFLDPSRLTTEISRLEAYVDQFTIAMGPTLRTNYVTLAASGALGALPDWYTKNVMLATDSLNVARNYPYADLVVSSHLGGTSQVSVSCAPSAVTSSGAVLLTSDGKSDYLRMTPGGGSQLVPQALIPENNSTPIETNQGGPTVYLYFMTGTRALNSHKSSAIFLVKYDPAGINPQLVILAQCAFNGFGNNTWSISAGETRVRILTPTGVGNSTWTGSRLIVQ